MKIKVKQMNGNDFEVELEGSDPTVMNLLDAISNKLNIDHERQRVIFSGRVLINTDTLASSAVTDGSVVHLVVRPENRPAVASTSSAPAPPTMTSTGISTGAGPQGMQFRNLGNGVTVGSMTISHDNLTQTTGDVGNLLNQIFSSVLPPPPEGQQNLPTSGSLDRSGSSSVPQSSSGGEQRPEHVHETILHQPPPPLSSDRSQELFLAESHLLALQQSRVSHNPIVRQSSASHDPASTLLSSLATSMHDAILPVMQLSQNLQQAQNPHLAGALGTSHSVDTQAEVYRVQNMLQHLSEASNHLANALQQTQLPPPRGNSNPFFPFHHAQAPGVSSQYTFHQNVTPSQPIPEHYPPLSSLQPQPQPQPQPPQPESTPPQPQQSTRQEEPSSQASSRPESSGETVPEPSVPASTTTSTAATNRPTVRVSRRTAGPQLPALPRSSGAPSAGSVSTDGQNRRVVRISTAPSFTSSSATSSASTPPVSGATGVMRITSSSSPLSQDQIQQHIETHRNAVATAHRQQQQQQQQQQERDTSTSPNVAISDPSASSTAISSPSVSSPSLDSSDSTEQSSTREPLPCSSSISTSSQPSPAASIRASVRAENSAPTTSTSSFSTSTSSSSASSSSPSPQAMMNLMGSVMNGVFPPGGVNGPQGGIITQIPNILQAAMQFVPPPTAPSTDASTSNSSNVMSDTQSNASTDGRTAANVPENSLMGGGEETSTTEESTEVNDDSSISVSVPSNDVVDDCLANFEFD
mmetsp:Transcript_20891/g.35223  ORF Transcript_20891/g.35223 Transcript_20891/m.35223 type:complete len:752 (+) Transcript_20891:44-2299(+)